MSNEHNCDVTERIAKMFCKDPELEARDVLWVSSCLLGWVLSNMEITQPEVTKEELLKECIKVVEDARDKHIEKYFRENKEVNAN